MKRLLKIIPKEKKSVDNLKLPLSKTKFIELNKKNIFIKADLKDINKFIVQSMIYLPLAYDINEFDIILIDFNEGNKPLYSLSSLDTIKYMFLDPESVDLSISLDELNKDKKTIFFIFEREDMSEVNDFDILLEKYLVQLSKNKNFRIITLSVNDKKTANTLTTSLEIKKTKFALEKDYIPDFFLKINQEINDFVPDVMSYRRSRISYLKNKRLI